MGSSEAFLISSMSSSSLDYSLTKSLSPALDNNSALTGLEQTFRSYASASKASFGLDGISTLDTDPLQDVFSNSSSHVGNVFNNSLLFKQPNLNAPVSSQALPSTTGYDSLTGSNLNTEIVGSISHDLLTNASVVSSPMTKNEISSLTLSPIFKTAFKVGSSVENAASNGESDSSVLEGIFGNSHPIFNGSFLPTSTAFSGDYFSHATVSGGGITPIILRNSNSGGNQNVVQGNGYGGNQNVVQGNGYGGNQNVVQGNGYGGNQNVVQGNGYGGDQNVVQGNG